MSSCTKIKVRFTTSYIMSWIDTLSTNPFFLAWSELDDNDQNEGGEREKKEKRKMLTTSQKARRVFLNQKRSLRRKKAKMMEKKKKTGQQRWTTGAPMDSSLSLKLPHPPLQSRISFSISGIRILFDVDARLPMGSIRQRRSGKFHYTLTIQLYLSYL